MAVMKAMRLFYGFDGRRIVGYDNERGKGDHRHFKGRETAYRFVNAKKLIADFLADVEKVRGGESRARFRCSRTACAPWGGVSWMHGTGPQAARTCTRRM